MQIKRWARENGVPAATLFSALKDGALARDEAGGIDPEEAHAWLAGRMHSRRGRPLMAHAEAQHAGRRHRRRQLIALAAQAEADIAKLRRQIDEMCRDTVPTDAARAAVDRRKARLRAAIFALPALHAADLAQAIGRPPEAARAVLERFMARLLRNLADLSLGDPRGLGRTSGTDGAGGLIASFEGAAPAENPP